MIMYLKMLLMAVVVPGAPPAPMPVPTVVQVRPAEAIPTATPSATPPPTPPPHASHTVDVGQAANQDDVSALIVLNPDSGQSSDNMLLTIHLVNSGPTYVPFSRVPPWVLVRLVVTDSNGKSSTYYDSKYQAAEIRGRQEILGAKSQSIVSYNGETEFSLSNWHMSLHPGRYLLQAIPRMGFSPFLTTVRSNTVAFTVK